MPAHRIQLEDLMRLPSVYFPTVSNNGRRMAFYWDKSGHIELYIIDLPNGEPQQISKGNVPKSLRAGFIWSQGWIHLVSG